MLTTRIIGVLNILDGIVVQSVNFLKYLPIGNPSIAVTFLNKWGIDEIIIQDIKATNNSECYLYKSLPKYVVNCQVPIAAGGGIKNLKDIENLIRNGADKVIINSAAHSNSKVINEGAKEFGDQAIIISIDIKKINDKYASLISMAKYIEEIRWGNKVQFTEVLISKEVDLIGFQNDLFESNLKVNFVLDTF